MVKSTNKIIPKIIGSLSISLNDNPLNSSLTNIEINPKNVIIDNQEKILNKLFILNLVEKIQPKSSKNSHHKCKNTNLFQKWV